MTHHVGVKMCIRVFAVSAALLWLNKRGEVQTRTASQEKSKAKTEVSASLSELVYLQFLKQYKNNG